jgi:imidazolonepropionase-like amidohydrolase
LKLPLILGKNGVQIMCANILFENVNLIDAAGNKPIKCASVLICDDIIKAVSPGKSIIPANTERIDLEGRTLMPGLIDLHVHVTLTDQLMPVVQGTASKGNSMIHAIQISHALKKTLQAGFTTIRDAGGAGKEIREAIEKGFIAGPRMLISCAILSQTGGHGDSRNTLTSRDGINWTGISSGSVVCDGVDEVIKAVREQVRAGADWIKVMAGGGVLSPDDKLDSSQYNVSELKAIVETAAADGIKVFAHCHSEASIRNSILAGVKTIEHGTFITDELIELMSKHDCALIPTLYVMNQIKIDELPERQKQKAITAVSKVNKTLTNAFKMRNKIDIGSGTDCFGNEDAGRNAWELTYKVEKGYTSMDAILSATRINAKILGMDDIIGTVEPGKKADLIVVEGNPLDDISILNETENIKMVLLDGKIVKKII